MKEMGAVELVDGKLYSFDYSENRTGEPIKGCRHAVGSNMLFALYDDAEMVACVEACDKCGRVLPLRRVAKDLDGSCLPLGGQMGRFRSLRRFICSH